MGRSGWPPPTWWPKPHNDSRGRVPQKAEASHGAYWHRRTQSGKPDLHPDRERGDHRTPHPHAAGAVRCSVRRESADEDPHRVIDRERVGGKMHRGARARGCSCRPELRGDVRDPEPQGEDGSARCKDAGRGLSPWRLSTGASSVGSSAAGASAARGTRSLGPDQDQVHLARGSALAK
jgi:hypothetical protein